MISLSVEQIHAFAEEHFPNAPEKMVELYGVEVRYSPLPFDGWCLQYGERELVRINSEAVAPRRRFTLAHELGHLILRVPTVVGESIFGDTHRKSAEEKKVDKLAAELLLPESVVLAHVKEIPVTATVIEQLAKKAKVSDLMVALRIAALSSSLGLDNASVVFYENDEMAWQWSATLQLTEEAPQEVLAECMRNAPTPARIPHEGRIVVASLLDNPYFNTKIVFLQLVPEAEGNKQLREERLRELEDYVFQGNVTFRQSLNGRFGMFRPTAATMRLTDALNYFNARIRQYPNTLSTEQVKRLLSEKGQEYLRLRLQVWTKAD
jgi:Zn-dependent peptidase ImmA (M78 family)